MKTAAKEDRNKPDKRKKVRDESRTLNPLLYRACWLVQHMIRRVDETGRRDGYEADHVARRERDAGVSWAGGQSAVAAATQVRLDVGGHRAGCRGLLVLQCPLLLGTVKLAQVVDAGVGLRRGAGADEVGDGDGSQQTNDGDHDHDFHQREARFAERFSFHVVNFLFLLHGVNQAASGFSIYKFNFHLLAGYRPLWRVKQTICQRSSGEDATAKTQNCFFS